MSLQVSRRGIVSKLIICTSIACAALASLGQAIAQGDRPTDKVIGREEFRAQCAACHGLDGDGHGPVAEFMKMSIPDLSTVTKRHGGHFPMDYLYRVIDGREKLAAHGTSEMPIWGKRYTEEAGSSPTAEALVRGRILELVYFIYSIQTDGTAPQP